MSGDPHDAEDPGRLREFRALLGAVDGRPVPPSDAEMAACRGMSGDTAGGVLERVDLTRAAGSRVHDVLLGSRRRVPLAVDRVAAAHVRVVWPHADRAAVEARRCLVRMVRLLAKRHGVRQFLDVGAGLPTVPDVHEVVEEVAPWARVVYVDRDPLVVLRHPVRRPPRPPGRIASVEGDLTVPGSIVDAPELGRVFDPGRPVAVLLSGVAEWVPDSPCGSPHDPVTALVEALGPGSWLAVTHVTADYAPQALAAAQEAYAEWGLALRPRTWREVEALFSGLHLLSPGVEVWSRWRPGPARTRHPCVTGYAGVGRLGDLPPGATRAPRWVPVT